VRHPDPNMRGIRPYIGIKRGLDADRAKEPWRAAFWAGAITFILMGGLLILLRMLK